MSEFEDKLNQILSSPEDMEKIMGLAKSMSGSLGSQETPKEPAPDSESLGAALPLGDIDPKMLKLMGRLMGEYSSKSGEKTALLTAMKPYLREERYETIDKAAKIARLAKIARIALTEFSGGDSHL